MADKPHYPFPNTINVANFVNVKLNGKNYLAWFTQVKSLVKTQKLMGFLTGETKPPAKKVLRDGNEEDNPVYADWEQSDDLVKSWLIGTLSEEVVGHIFELEMASQVWQTLANRFAKKSESQEFALLAQLYSLQKGNRPLADHLSDFQSILNQLSLIGKPISDSGKTFRLLQSLGKEYESFKQTMPKPPVPCFEDVLSQLQACESRLISYSESPNENAIIIAQRNQRGGGRGQRGGRSGSNFSS